MWEIVIVCVAFIVFQLGRLAQWVNDAKDAMKGERRRR